MSPRRAIAAAFLVVALGAAAPGRAVRAQAGEGSGPSSSPATPALFAEAERTAAALPRLHSLLVSERGMLVFERYYHGARASRLANVKSVSKSIIAALVGIAIDRGLIKGVQQPIRDFFPTIPGDAAREKGAITVEDLVTMRSGLESTSSRNYGAWVRSPNWVRYALARPLLSAPGTTMDYSTGNSHCCRPSSPKPRAPARGSSRARRLPRRSASRWRGGRRIRRASTSAATRCCSRRAR